MTGTIPRQLMGFGRAALEDNCFSGCSVARHATCEGDCSWSPTWGIWLGVVVLLLLGPCLLAVTCCKLTQLCLQRHQQKVSRLQEWDRGSLASSAGSQVSARPGRSRVGAFIYFSIPTIDTCPKYRLAQLVQLVFVNKHLWGWGRYFAPSSAHCQLHNAQSPPYFVGGWEVQPRHPWATHTPLGHLPLCRLWESNWLRNTSECLWTNLTSPPKVSAADCLHAHADVSQAVSAQSLVITNTGPLCVVVLPGPRPHLRYHLQPGVRDHQRHCGPRPAASFA